ncbi:cell division inhibitor SepF [Nakamurella panacisegetis]|uniref:Cell division protein SepF n=1 Tax=Nakamurella panacisegetis TaxID=1090615 RepID=A0A1H0QAH1_9ACTN|nr:cell division protein SepF [Nakamurella panacisegetis]SDP14055.1 cell division inhibitor SepF [Nakamurella panacisegetis]
MGSWRKVGAFLGLVPDEGHHYEGDDYEAAGYEGSQYDDGYDSPRDRSGSYAGSSYSRDADAGYSDGYADRKSDHPAESYRSEAPEPVSSRPVSSSRRPFASEPVTQGALAMKADQRRDADSSTASRPASVKLTGFGEARIVGEKYRDGQSVILDMTGMSDSDARRLVDFSAGLAFSLRGSIEKVAPKVFMLLPAEADIAGGSATALEDARAYVGGYAGR